MSEKSYGLTDNARVGKWYAEVLQNFNPPFDFRVVIRGDELGEEVEFPLTKEPHKDLQQLKELISNLVGQTESEVPKHVYCKLSIEAVEPETDIWISADDEIEMDGKLTKMSSLVQKGEGKIETSLAYGVYYVTFGDAKGERHQFELMDNKEIHEKDFLKQD